MAEPENTGRSGRVSQECPASLFIKNESVSVILNRLLNH